MFILGEEKKENAGWASFAGPHGRGGQLKGAHTMAWMGWLMGASSAQVLQPMPLGLVTASQCSGLERPLLITLSRCSAPRTKGLFSGCWEGRSLLAGCKMAFLDGNIWLQ